MTRLREKREREDDLIKNDDNDHSSGSICIDDVKGNVLSLSLFCP